MISILILTLNEERNLPACLESVKWSDDVVVFDSFSTDRTVEIARAFGARVIQRRFDNWAAHQNWANENIKFKYPWVYYSDADEIVTQELRDELLAVVRDGSRSEVAYRVRFKNMFMGRWIKRSSLYPTWVLRFFRPANITWEREVNPVPVVTGETGWLQAHFEHHSFNNGLSAWFEKHNRYSDGEAREAVKVLGSAFVRECASALVGGEGLRTEDGGRRAEGGGRRTEGGGRRAEGAGSVGSGSQQSEAVTKERPHFDWKGLFAVRDPARRRKALKALAWHLPCRAGLVFVYLYVFRMGFLDGAAGWRYCRMRAIYEYMIDLKIVELRRREKGLPV